MTINTQVDSRRANLDIRIHVSSYAFGRSCLMRILASGLHRLKQKQTLAISFVWQATVNIQLIVS